MLSSKNFLLAVSLLGSCFFFGCASSYHAYPCGKVPYCYCPPSPLPHTDYNACPTCLASKYLARPADAPTATSELGQPSQWSPQRLSIIIRFRGWRVLSLGR